MTPYYEQDGITIYHGDCREVLPTLPPSDLVFSSPPYAEQRRYGFGDGEFNWGNVVPRALASVNVEPDGQLLINLGLVRKNGELVCYWDGLIATMRSFGFRLFDWYVWDQCDGLAGAWSGHFAPSHEWIFHFNRASKEPAKFVPCKHVGARHTGGMRNVSGKIVPKSGSGRTVAAFKVPDSVIRLQRQKHNDTGHPAVFPVDLAMFALNAYPGSVIDPFMGSGTTLIAAQQLGRRAIGIEIEERYCEIAAKRLSQGVLPMEASA